MEVSTWLVCVMVKNFGFCFADMWSKRCFQHGIMVKVLVSEWWGCAMVKNFAFSMAAGIFGCYKHCFQHDRHVSWSKRWFQNV
jgi:hypothetical protein